ncbi:hypothetical protein [Oscillochloris sp. ZM17-4]|uniref:hypothetical protein n=1 Tax=Oscillochloris sp. ZM17-4 TaxID=2866714 RepID=UPI001C72B78C|nr:hypothetical protein [Oscillochloris sp. ZM17-4]
MPLALAAIAMLVVLAAYQVPFQGQISLVADPSPVVLSGVYAPESTLSGTAQRWTSPQARITIPGVGAGDAIMRLHLFGGNAADAGRTLQIRAGDRDLAQVTLRPSWQVILLEVPAGAFDLRSGDLTLDLRVAALYAPQDRRELGVSLSDLDLWPVAGPRAWPLGRALQLVLVSTLILWALRLAGLGARAAVSAALAPLLALGAALALTAGGDHAPRFQAALALDVLTHILPLTLALAALLRLGTSSWARAPGGARWAAPLRVAVLLIFTLRLSGVAHPQFVPIDQELRANQLIGIAEGRLADVLPRLEQQHEWGTREAVPYSLFTYYLLLPLVWLTDSRDQLVAAVKLVTVLADASVPLLLWAMLRRDPQGGEVAAWAGLTYAALPVGYIFFHDGSFPTTLGLWVTLAALAAYVTLVAEYEPPAGWRSPGGALRWLLCALLLAFAIAAYVTQVVFVPFLVGGLAASLIMLGDGPGQRRAGWRLTGLLAAGLVVAWLLVYAGYTVTLLTRTIPAYLGLIAAQGTVGREADSFFGTPINSFPQHLDAHFRVWPVLLGSAALAGLLSGRRRLWAAHLGLAYGMFIAATSLAELVFGLWNKHMYFAAPGVALLSGSGLAWLWRRGRAGQVICVALLASLFWSGAVAWANRSIWYILPPSAL